MLNDPTFWVLVSFIIFVGLVWWKARGVLSGALDARVERIQAELDEVKSLRNQAQEALSQQRAHNRKAEEQIIAMKETAKLEAAEQARIARVKLEKTLAQKSELALQRIAQAEASVIKEISDQTLNKSAQAAYTILVQQMSGDIGSKTIADSIDQVSQLAQQNR